MNTRLTKGAISAAAAAVLLLGGAGSLAYWSDAQDATGTDVNSGHLKLDVLTAGTWHLNGETAVYNPAVQRMVPGDTLTKTVVFTVDAEGDYLEASFEAENPAWETGGAAALIDEIDLTGAYSVSTDSGATWSAPTNGSTPIPVEDGDRVRAVLTVDWPMGVEDNDSNVAAGLTASLDDVSVTITQD